MFFSCTTQIVPPVTPPEMPSYAVSARGVKSADKLVDFFLDRNKEFQDIKQVERLANYYVTEAALEGINSDVAWVQMCLETGFLTYGNLVTKDMNNFCGLGAIDEAHPGLAFPTEQEGVRAHIQHLHAYGTTGSLRQTLVDPRYKYVQPRGKAVDVFALSGTWAADPRYGEKLRALIDALGHY
jgi:hypothetical protein